MEIHKFEIGDVITNDNLSYRVKDIKPNFFGEHYVLSCITNSGYSLPDINWLCKYVDKDFKLKDKYEESLKIAKQELKACGSYDSDAARQIFRIFPELKNISIKECLLGYFKKYQDAIETSRVISSKKCLWEGIEVQNIIDWLNKVEPNN